MINLVVLTGRLCSDVELKTTPNGSTVTSFNIAVNRPYRSGEERQADFITLVAWNKQAEFISKYFHKGDMIAIEGRIQTRKYQDKDGNNRTAFEVLINNAQFVEGNKKNEEKDPLIEFSENLKKATNDFVDLGDASNDDLPF